MTSIQCCLTATTESWQLPSPALGSKLVFALYSLFMSAGSTLSTLVCLPLRHVADRCGPSVSVCMAGQLHVSKLLREESICFIADTRERCRITTKHMREPKQLLSTSSMGHQQRESSVLQCSIRCIKWQWRFLPSRCSCSLSTQSCHRLLF